MQIILAAVGKIKPGPERTLFEHYAGRLPWKISVRECEVRKAVAGKELQEQEGRLLKEACAGIEYAIALDEKGREFTSRDFATHIVNLRDRGVRSLSFIIGGADGLHEARVKEAQLCLSLGRFTWPHMLVRGLLAEQLYRAHTIISGHPYHRD